ncbi:MAG: TatD family hydrolase, partial [Duncaniella sp.]|uniref:TatD family hydrolase n=1 Tax=Duncaniella sp. TaxID=2518496 RepID=UPI0023CC4D37
MLIDTHTHLYLDEFSPTPEAAVERAIAADVKKLIFPNVYLGTIGPMNRLRDSFPGHIFMAMGLHPTEINENWESDLAEIEAELTADPAKYIAIGEIGIDLYWDQTFRKQQQAAFSRQVDWA